MSGFGNLFGNIDEVQRKLTLFDDAQIKAKLFGDISRAHEAFLNPFKESIENSTRLNTIADLSLEKSALYMKALEWQVNSSKASWLELQDSIQRIQEDFRGMVAQLSGTPFDGYVDTLLQTKKHFQSLLSLPDSRFFSDALAESIAPTVAAIRLGQLELGTGIMTVDQFKQHGTFTWVQENKGKGNFASAVWSRKPAKPLREVSHSTNVLIVCEVKCSDCGELILPDNEKVYLESANEFTISISITPSCENCGNYPLDRESLESYSEQFSRFVKKRSKPTLYLIQGNGKGEAKSQSRTPLYLVKSGKGDKEND